MTGIYKDRPAARIDYRGWHRLFRAIPDELIDEYRYYRWAGKTDWNTYLQPPSTFAIYGARYLKRLTYDNSLASLRLWGFMLNEGERIYRARQMGRRIVAVMGDLGPVPVLVWSFPNLVPFYPDCLWWTPFLNESNVLFETAERLGLGEDCCYVRAALGAFAKRAYFPDPDIAIASTGASCDDMAAVIQLARWTTGINIHYIELPFRRAGRLSLPGEKMISLDGVEAPQAAYDLLVEQFGELIGVLEDLSGHKFDRGRFHASVEQANHLRRLVAEIKDVTYSSSSAPLPALELMNIEFMTLTGYGDMDESVNILEHILSTVRRRIADNEGLLPEDAVLAAWVNPTADPLLLCWWEDLGGRVVATEYVIRQALQPLPLDGRPEEILAQGILAGSLIGSSAQRAQFIIEEAQRYKAEGAIISSIFASSHCATETWLIRDELSRSLKGPVLTFNVVGPGKAHQQAQIRTRLEALVESMRARRGLSILSTVVHDDR